MAKVLVSDQYLTDIANAIREKNETNITYTPSQMANAILSISNENSGGSINLQDKTVTPSESQQTISCDNNYNGLGTVIVNAISSAYVGSGVSRQGVQTIIPTTANQTIAVNTYLTGVQTIAGDTDLTASNIKHGIDIFGVTGTFQTRIGNLTASINSRGRTMTFSNVVSNPLAFAIIVETSETSISESSYGGVTSVIYDGSTIYCSYARRTGNKAASMYSVSSGVTSNYSGTTLTVTLPSSSNYYFYPYQCQYRLIYIYEQ